MESARPWFERRRQVVTTQASGEQFADVDQTRVAQVLTNLLHNAAKFTPEGGAIRVELGQEDAALTISVVDSGTGILSDQLERVFDMFARIARPGVATEPGLGIGLALSRRLAEMHGGTLHASSDGEGRGATFVLRLPVSAEVPAPASSPAPRPANTPQGAPLDIVVVEDNADIADGLVDWLAELGHRVAVARTGVTGVEAIHEHRPDLVLCDLGLPEMDGLEVCRRVRRFSAERQPIMVALTGWGRDDDRDRTQEAGFDLHLVKPVAPEKLQEVLRQAGERRVRRPEPPAAK